jgi:transcriptional regulator with XRE-family HTH domain
MDSGFKRTGSGAVIFSLRKKHHLSQSALANILGYGRVHISNIELFNYPLNEHALARFQKHFGLPTTKRLMKISGLKTRPSPQKWGRTKN